MSSERRRTSRLFAALAVPAEVKNELRRAQNELRDRLPSDRIRWTSPEQMHLTLRFFGNVDNTRIDELIESLRSACANARALQLNAAGIGFFPHSRRPRVIWAGIEGGDDQLVELQKQVISGSAAFVSAIEEKAFAAHVTIARIKEINSNDIRTLQDASNRMADRKFGTWTADSLEIIRSELDSTGSRYSLIATIPLIR